MHRLLIALALSPAAMAQDISPIGAFTGEFSEGFETQGAQVSVSCIDPAFGGDATVCAPNATIGGMYNQREFFQSCLQDAYEGDYQVASNDSWAEVRFDFPLGRFGGYFGTHASDGDVTLIFLDADDAEIGRVTEAFDDSDNSGGTCDWQWVGGETTGAGIWTIRIRHSNHAGALVTIDALEASTGCGLDDLDCDGSTSANDCDDLDPLRTPGATEVCDGIDNDCDGSVPANEADGDSDGYAGCIDCDDSDATVHPDATESCDGVDEDCDNATDEEATGGAWGSLTSGVCANTYQVCDNGTWVDPDYTQLTGYELDEASCDGDDNDCDGSVDEALLGGPASQGQGVCADLRQECAGEAGWVDPNDWAAQVAYEPTELSCDGLDNDCDGSIDETLEDPPSADLQLGVCAGAEQECAGSEGWVEPDYGTYSADYSSVDDSCNAVDNDCDGAFDESCEEDEPPRNTTRNPFEDCGCASTPSGAVGWMALGLAAVGLRRRRDR